MEQKELSEEEEFKVQEANCLDCLDSGYVTFRVGNDQDGYEYKTKKCHCQDEGGELDNER